MTAKEYLKQIVSFNIKLKSMARQVAALEDALTDISPVLSGMPRTATPNVHRLDGLIATKLDLEREIEVTSQKLGEVYETINTLPEKYRVLITERYIGGLPWRKIAEEMFIGERQLYRLHGEALKAVERVLDERKRSQ